MTTELSRDQSAVVTAGRGSSNDERRGGRRRLSEWLGGSRAADKRMGVGRGVIWFGVIALVIAAVPVSQGMVFKAGSGFGYYIGIIGAVMMLLMLLYPIRKHMRFAQSWGPLRYWFMLHMLFGICGPILVLFHSTFHVKSLNAGVSLFSMLLVASSGIIGRFIYTRIHHGLYGRKSELKELQQAVDANQQKVKSVLLEAPGISEKLKAFREAAMAQGGSPLARAWKFMSLGRRRRKLAAKCREELRQAVIYFAKSQGWDHWEQDRRWHEVAAQMDDYLNAVQEAAQYTAYERLFRLWHILHTPFVYSLGISAVVHVIAVNMY